MEAASQKKMEQVGLQRLLHRLELSRQANARLFHPRLALAGMGATLLPHGMFNLRRTALYRAAGLRLERGVQILGPLTLIVWGKRTHLLEIEEDAALDTPCVIDLFAPVRIGRKVHIGREALIMTGSHQIGTPEERCGPDCADPVEIGAGAWLGSRVTVLPGVVIGAGCVVQAGAVVTRSMPPHSLVSGNPARVIGKLGETTPMMPSEDGG